LFRSYPFTEVAPFVNFRDLLNLAFVRFQLECENITDTRGPAWTKRRIAQPIS
jgi:hypothetical protein